MDAKSVRNIESIITVTNKHTAKLHHVGSLYILTYDARKLKHKTQHVSSKSSCVKCVKNFITLLLFCGDHCALVDGTHKAKFKDHPRTGHEGPERK